MTQKEALHILKTGRNVFLTGAAGSGKTYVLREYIKYLHELGADVGITASTGIAATHMGGITLHSWAGIGIRDSLTKSDLAEIAEKPHVKNRLRYASILIVDEVSMLHHFRLDLVDKVLRQVKEVDEPFGGIQVIFCGDFFQLPPVSRRGEPDAFFAYHSDVWKSLNLKVCYLEEQHRQNDASYLKVLNAIRENKVDKEVREILNTRHEVSLRRDLRKFPKGLAFEEATRLYSHNVNVDTENERELQKIPGKIFEYEMESRGKKPIVEALKKSCLAPETLRLKEGAKVMFVKNNFEEGYVNGTLGVVLKCDRGEIEVRTVSGRVINVPPESWQVEEEGRLLGKICQYPLRLAWAITVHKSQGMSLDSAEVDLSQSFEEGMGYVALSRVRSLAGLYLKGLNEMALQVNREVLEFDKKFRELSRVSTVHIQTMDQLKIDKMHQEFADKVRGAVGSKKKKKKPDTLSETKNLLENGFGIKEIATMRRLEEETIVNHLTDLKKKGLVKPKDLEHIKKTIPLSKFRAISAAFHKVGVAEGDSGYRLSPAKNLLGSKYSYEDLQLVRLFM